MSYDLYFRRRDRAATLTRDEFVAYFCGRRHYEVDEPQAWYRNEDTGVYFVFNYEDPDEEDEPAAPGLIPVALNINFFRPHPFGLEAEPEIRAFVEHFDLTVFDPQDSGTGEGEYSAEGFLRGWNAGNEFACRAVAHRNPPEARLSLPAAQIEAAWRWNLARETCQTEVGDGMFVPRIFFANAGGRIKTLVAWGDGIPIVLPVVDIVFVPRSRLVLCHSLIFG